MATAKRAKRKGAAKRSGERGQRAARNRRSAKRPGRRPERRGESTVAERGRPVRWSAEVARRSNALDLEPSLFTWDDPKRIAESLKRSAEASKRRKGTPFQSAMSMLNFYINRAGTNLPQRRRQVLEQAKTELRRAFGREP